MGGMDFHQVLLFHSTDWRDHVLFLLAMSGSFSLQLFLLSQEKSVILDAIFYCMPKGNFV